MKRERRRRRDCADSDLLVTTSTRPGLHAKLTALAKSEKLSRNKLVLDILEAYVKENYPEVSNEIAQED